MAGAARWVNTSRVSPIDAPHERVRAYRASASSAICIRSVRVSSRKRLIRPAAAAVAASGSSGVSAGGVRAGPPAMRPCRRSRAGRPVATRPGDRNHDHPGDHRGHHDRRRVLRPVFSCLLVPSGNSFAVSVTLLTTLHSKVHSRNTQLLREIRLVGPDRIGATGRQLPVLLAAEGGEVEEVVRAAGGLQAARVLGVGVEHPSVDSSPRAYCEYVWNTRPSTCRKQLRPGISNGCSESKKRSPRASYSAFVR